MMAIEVRAQLIADGLATVGRIYTNTLPASPNTCVAVDETGGTGGVDFFGEDVGLEQPGLRIRTRGEPQDSAAPREAIEAIKQSLMSKGAITASGTRYLSFTPLQSPYPLTRDSDERVVWAVNFLVLKEHSPTS